MPSPRTAPVSIRGTVAARAGPTTLRRAMDAPGLVLSPSATVGRGVRFGAHDVVHDGVVLGDDCVVEDHAVLRKPPARGPHAGADAEPLVLGRGVRGCTAAVV